MTLETTAIPLPSSRKHLFDPPELGLPDERQPICRLSYPDGRPGWLVTNYELAKAVLTSPDFGAVGVVDKPIGDLARAEEIGEAMDLVGFPSFLGKNPPDHTRMKRMVAGYFSATHVAALEPRLEEIVAAQLDQMQTDGPPADLVRAFAAPVSLQTQCALLGIAPEDAQRFYRLGTSTNAADQTGEDVAEAYRECGDYVRGVLERERQAPSGGIIAEIAVSEDLSDTEAAGMIMLLVLGGLETTGDMLALGAFMLLRYESQLDAFRADPSTAASTVEELLRFGGIFRVVVRVALRNLEVGGQQIAAGERVTVSLAAANRDPAKFSCPHELEIHRDSRDHLAFGKGIHMCLGQRLARLELKIGLTRLFERFPELSLDVPAEEVPTYGEDQLNYGVLSLPVSW